METTNTATFPCQRCNGAGRMSQFANVIGGTCFKCNGTGQQRTKPSKPTPKWAVFGQHRTSGAWLRLYNVVAKTKDKAIEQAQRIYLQASQDWKDTYTLNDARALRWTEMASAQALSWDEAFKQKEQA